MSWHYTTVVYAVGAFSVFPMLFFFGSGYSGLQTGFYLCGLLLALVPQMVGHTSFNWSVRWVSSTFFTLLIVLEPAGSSFLGYLVFGEAPGYLVLLGAALLAGVATAVLGNRQQA